jgi:hypothetical protein
MEAVWDKDAAAKQALVRGKTKLSMRAQRHNKKALKWKAQTIRKALKVAFITFLIAFLATIASYYPLWCSQCLLFVLSIAYLAKNPLVDASAVHGNNRAAKEDYDELLGRALVRSDQWRALSEPDVLAIAESGVWLVDAVAEMTRPACVTTNSRCFRRTERRMVDVCEAEAVENQREVIRTCAPKDGVEGEASNELLRRANSSPAILRTESPDKSVEGESTTAVLCRSNSSCLKRERSYCVRRVSAKVFDRNSFSPLKLCTILP